jgi:integrase/recombinase XerD
LRRWITQERLSHPGAENNEYLFPSRLGGKLSSNGFTKLVKDAAEDAGIQETDQSKAPIHPRKKEMLGTDKDYLEYHKVVPHSLRHTFNHLLKEAGIPRDARSEALDHSSESVTKKFYDHNESNYEELIQGLFSNMNSLVDS